MAPEYRQVEENRVPGSLVRARESFITALVHLESAPEGSEVVGVVVLQYESVTSVQVGDGGWVTFNSEELRQALEPVAGAEARAA